GRLAVLWHPCDSGFLGADWIGVGRLGSERPYSRPPLGTARSRSRAERSPTGDLRRLAGLPPLGGPSPQGCVGVGPRTPTTPCQSGSAPRGRYPRGVFEPPPAGLFRGGVSRGAGQPQGAPRQVPGFLVADAPRAARSAARRVP